MGAAPTADRIALFKTLQKDRILLVCGCFAATDQQNVESDAAAAGQ
jgi:hypothetical protein